MYLWLLAHLSRKCSEWAIVIMLCLSSRGHIFSPILVKLGPWWNHTQVWNWVMWGQKLGHILEKPCVSSRGPIFRLILMKLGQNVCLDEISEEFENGSCGVKNLVTWWNLIETLCTLSRPHFWSESLVRIFASMKTWTSMKMGHNRSNTRSNLKKNLCKF